MSKQTVSGRVPADTETRLNEFCEERGISKSDGVRRVLIAGLDELEGEDEDEGGGGVQGEGELVLTSTTLKEWAVITGVWGMVAFGSSFIVSVAMSTDLVPAPIDPYIILYFGLGVLGLSLFLSPLFATAALYKYLSNRFFPNGLLGHPSPIRRG